MEGKPRVLIIDDDVDYVRINRVVLERNGYEVATAATSAEGVEKACECKPDAIILDLMMETTTSGAPVAQMLREHDGLAHVPILLVTGVRSLKPWWKDLRPQQDWLPVDKVIEKPVGPERLLAEVAAALADR